MDVGWVGIGSILLGRRRFKNQPVLVHGGNLFPNSAQDERDVFLLPVNLVRPRNAIQLAFYIRVRHESLRGHTRG